MFFFFSVVLFKLGSLGSFDWNFGREVFGNYIRGILYLFRGVLMNYFEIFVVFRKIFFKI